MVFSLCLHVTFVFFLELMGKYSNISQQILPTLPEAWEATTEHSAGKASLVWMYGEFGEVYSKVTYNNLSVRSSFMSMLF